MTNSNEVIWAVSLKNGSWTYLSSPIVLSVFSDSYVLGIWKMKPFETKKDIPVTCPPKEAIVNGLKIIIHDTP